MYITENGVDDPTGELDDQFRVGYIRNYTNEVLKGKFADWGWEIHESKPLVHHVNCKKHSATCRLSVIYYINMAAWKAFTQNIT